MAPTWKNVFSHGEFPWQNENALRGPVVLKNLDDLKRFLDCIHIKYCLAKPYFETENYPLVDVRDLLPSFESDPLEYKQLPGFSLVAFNRGLSYFHEVFQYDILHPVMTPSNTMGAFCPLENQVINQNTQTILARLPRTLQEEYKSSLSKVDITALDYYAETIPYLLGMDRGQVLAQDSYGQFYLAGVFASFPSDIDSELKRFGLRIGKFVNHDDETYERNRSFVYQFLMELYGFPICSERRTASALFARRLHKMGEQFLVRVLGQSDRTITTLYSGTEASRYPKVEKLALVAVDPDQEDTIALLRDAEAFIDPKKRVVIVRVGYMQHRYNTDNVRQDRALSMLWHEVVHPKTGRGLRNINIIRDSTSTFLRLNDIVRGEYTGSIIYKRTEVVENTDTEEKQLKFLYAWLTKNQRRVIGYRDDFFEKMAKVLDNYLYPPEKEHHFELHHELHQEVCSRYSYILQARKVRMLEDLRGRTYKGERINYQRQLTEVVSLLTDLKFEIATYFESLVGNAIHLTEQILNDYYLRTHYGERSETELTPAGMEVRKTYRRIVSILDEIKAVHKARKNTEQK